MLDRDPFLLVKVTHLGTPNPAKSYQLFNCNFPPLISEREMEKIQSMSLLGVHFIFRAALLGPHVCEENEAM